MNANDHRFYVYEWYIIDSGKVFYVGKGVGKRRFNIASRNSDFKRLCTDFKTKSRIVYDNLTDDEALELEAKHMLKRKVEGCILVNTINEYDFLDWDEFDNEEMAFIDKECDESERTAINDRKFIPFVKVSDYFNCYYGAPKDAVFDSISLVDFSAWFHLRVTEQRNDRVIKEIAFLQQAIKKIGGKIYKSKSKNVKYIVEFDLPDYEEVIEKRNAGYKVIHALDLVRFFNNGQALEY